MKGLGQKSIMDEMPSRRGIHPECHLQIALNLFLVFNTPPKGSNSLVLLCCLMRDQGAQLHSKASQQVVNTKFTLPACWALQPLQSRARPSIETCAGLIEASSHRAPTDSFVSIASSPHSGFNCGRLVGGHVVIFNGV